MLRDIDYVVDEGKFKSLMDLLTYHGRSLLRWSLTKRLKQRRVEAENEPKTMATITYQNYLYVS